jgi:hypothetical protein
MPEILPKSVESRQGRKNFELGVDRIAHDGTQNKMGKIPGSEGPGYFQDICIRHKTNSVIPKTSQ